MPLAARRSRASDRSSRSYASIVVANVATVFNLILLAFGVLTLALGDPRDALFLGIVVANSAIGIVQEVRAKRTLDRLQALVAPTATVVRDGARLQLPAAEVRVGDQVLLAPGDQLVADARVEHADWLRLDESVLTGEARPVARRAGDEVHSGSFVAEGTARATVTATGDASYAGRVVGEARAFRHPRSPLEHGIDRLLGWLVVVMVPLALVLGVSLVARDVPPAEAVPRATAAMVSLVPEGLVLLASLTFAVAAVRTARRGALAQQLNAIESLASVDVLCLDKTGTLTEAALRVVDAVPAPGVPAGELEAALRVAAAGSVRNLTADALAERFAAGDAAARAEVPFSSRRRWSAVETAAGTVVLGAPEVLLDGGPPAARAVQETARGRRVLAVAAAAPGLEAHDPDRAPPPGRRVLGVVVLAERLRPDARATVAFLREQGVALKVLSGDAPATVAAVAADAGIETGEPLDGASLPEDPAELARVMQRTAVVGRISPEGKRRVVEALTAAGAYVGMVGDGVNDVPALKASRLAIGQGSGTPMARAVADLVLLTGSFASVPGMVAEGRQILGNVSRVARIFVAKSSLAAFLIVTVGTTALAYPFLPRHLTIASTFGVGVPGFFLALAPGAGRWRPDRFLHDVAVFAVPGGIAVALGVLAGYLLALEGLGLRVEAARTAATSVLLVGMLQLVVEIERHPLRRRRMVQLLVLVMAAGYAAVLATPALRDFFALAVPGPRVLAAAAAGCGLTALVLSQARRLWEGDEDRAAAVQDRGAARVPTPVSSR
jgi:P-type E1-E2 ATPase